MVLPAVAATGRVIAGSARTTGRAAPAKRDPLVRTPIRRRRDERQNNQRMQAELKAESPSVSVAEIQARMAQQAASLQAQAIAQKKAQKKVSPMDLMRAGLRTVRAIAAAMTTLGFYVWFYGIQLAFGILSIVANQLEQTWMGWFFPGDTISILGWAVASIISTVFMFIAIVSLVTVRAKVGKNLTMLTFLVGIAGSITPVFNLLPWPALFLAVAAANQK